MRTIRILTFFCWIGTATAFGQEICNNGIDDDGDGFIDCFDSNCANNSFCDGTFLGNDVSCQAQPTQFPTFSMRREWFSENKTAVHFGRMAIGDLDNDGIPEVVTYNTFDEWVYILNGDDGSKKFSRDVGNEFRRRFPHDIAIANLDNDDCGEIFVMGTNDNNSSFRIVSYNCRLERQWRRDVSSRYIGSIGLADFNGDGSIELYYKNEILDARTGNVLVEGKGEFNDLAMGTVAVDIQGDSDLELVVGGIIYEVDIAAGTAVEIKSMPGYNVKGSFPSTSVADYNQDGNLDIIATGGDNNDISTVFFWDLTTDVVLTYSDAFGNGRYEKGWDRGMGRVNIADIDGDGRLNATFVSGEYLYALDENLNLKWRSQINEESSGFTGCTLFDFNGDNVSEIVYRDEQWLYIINGKDGLPYNNAAVACISRTHIEYPIVADVDGDGATELCVTCGYNNNNAWNNFNNNAYSENSHVRVFESAGEPWVPARRLWNQHAYFNVNVNDDLTIPAIQQQHHLAFSNGSCTTGPNRPLNSFLNQSPYLDSDGCPVYASPDLAFVDNSLNVQQPNCPDMDFQVSFEIENLGDIELTGDLPITFYEGDPRTATANKLNTEIVPVANLVPGATLALNNMIVNGTGGDFELFIVLNDDGTTIPLNLPNTDFFECDYDNNILSATINPVPFALTAETTDNTVCDVSLPGNGSARAYRLVGPNEETADYTFHWHNGNTVNGTADFTGAVYSNLSDGDYTVYAVHNTASCSSDTITVNVGLMPGSVTAAIILQNQYTNCQNPNGGLRAEANGGDPVGFFDFAWYQGDNIFTSPLIGTSHNINNLGPSQYTLLVTEKSTGCETIETYTIIDDSAPPTVTATANDANCPNPASGSVEANVTGGNGGHRFEWFIGDNVKPSPDFTTRVVNGLTAGDYTVVAINNSDQCSSAPATVTVSIPPDPVVTASMLTEQTSCDAGNPNGSATANVGGTTNGFTFTWYEGQGTTGTVVSNTANASGLSAGPYTVEAVNNLTSCSSTAEVTISETLTYPAVSVNVDNDQTDCVPPNGQLSANVGGVTTGFTFLWYNGNVGTPDLNNPDATGNTYAGLVAGDYTVVALNSNTFCPSTPVVTSIADNTVIPVIAVNVTDQTSCDPASPNGALSANVGGVTAGYSFTWHRGAGTAGVVVASTADATGLAAGVYTVEAVNDATGCANTFRTTINNNFTFPVVAAVVDANQSDCAPANGQLSANVGGVTTGFTFLWYNGNVGTPDLSNPDATGATYTGLTAGEYTVVAVNSNTQCPSTPVVATVADNTVLPNVVAAKTDNTACDPALNNGTISAGVGTVGTVAGYTFRVFSGQTTAPASEVPGSPGDVISGLGAGIYTVQATNNATGCANTVEITVNNNIVQPLLSVAGTDVTNCSPLNGSITAYVTVGSVTDYTFSWYDGSTATGTPYSTTGNVLSGLDAGTYTVTAYNDVLGCQVQAPQTITIDRDPSSIITITELASELIIPSSCNVGGGQLGVEASSPGNTGGFSFTWYEGDVNTGLTLVGNGTDFPTNSNRLGSLSSGRYTVIAQDNDTGCEDTLSIDLPYAGAPSILSVNIQNNDNCTVPNGSFEVDLTPSASAVALGADETWFEIQIWMDGALAQPAQQGSTTNNIFNNLEPGDYTIIAVETNPALSGCTTTENASIANNAVPPAITANAISNNRNCNGAIGTGTISLSIDGTPTPISGYDYNWYEGQDTSAPALPAANITAPGHTIVDLTGGYYTVEVIDNTDPNETCLSEATFFVSDDPYIISINSPDINLIHQTNCSPPFLGGATVTDVYIDGTSNGGTGGFTFEWFESDGVTPVAGAGTTDALAVVVSPGDYFVRATNTTSNCISSLVAFEILDNTVNPNVVMVQDAPNTVCDMVNFLPNGQLSASVTEGATPNVITGYNFEWFTGQNNTATGSELPAANITGASGEIAQNLAPGFYTVRVTDTSDPNNTCQTVATLQVQDIPDIVTIAAADLFIDDQSNCSPINSSATVNQVMVNGTGQLTSGFTFAWFDSSATPIGAAGTGPSFGTTLMPGTYFVQATSITSGCASSLVQFEIQDVTEVPIVVMVQDAPNTVCDMVNFSPNGQLSASVTEGTTTGVTTGYNFEWFTGQNNTAIGSELPAANITGASGEIAQNLAPGFYTVRVTDTNDPNNGCQTVATLQVQDMPDMVTIATADLSVNDQTTCTLNTSATVSQVMVNGAGQPTSNFTFTWFDSNANPIAAAGNGPSFGTTLMPGTYFVQAIPNPNNTGCVSSLVQFEIRDLTVLPEIALVSFTNPTVCDQPNVMGELSVTADGSTNTTDYTFTWYEGTDASGVLIPGNNPVINNITGGGNFYLEVTNNNTGCMSSAQYTLLTEIQDILVNANATDVTNCVSPDGTLFATVMGINSNNYDYFWYNGNTATATPDHTGKNVTGLDMGDYTIVAVDQADPTCTSVPIIVTIGDGRIYPELALVQVNPVTNCSAAVPNGAARAMVNGTDIGYTFDWFVGSGINGTPFYTGSQANGLSGITYTVLATNISNGCTSIAEITIDENFDEMPLPNPEVISHQTSCTISNSVIVVSVDGNTANYIFTWYNGQDVSGTPVYTGDRFTGADPGFYTVTATAISSGCVSEGVTVELLEELKYPDFNLVVENADCGENNGSIKLNLTEEVIVRSIVWNTPSGEIFGPNLVDYPAGDYQVTVTTDLGCTATKSVSIQPNIIPYNGVSFNGDGMNDFFIVSCLELYPNNKVKIFNRAGTLVYETDGYDNIDNIFNGTANKGISVLGSKLPSGTYFYVIDKMDNSEAVSGYLELLND